jgi:ABC-type Mn2+/Zn2+ transport system permease subunit
MVARNMRQFMVLASLIGGLAAFLGFCIAYKFDLPVGPTDVVLLGFLYAVTWIIARIVPHGGLRYPHNVQ